MPTRESKIVFTIDARRARRELSEFDRLMGKAKRSSDRLEDSLDDTNKTTKEAASGFRALSGSVRTATTAFIGFETVRRSTTALGGAFIQTERLTNMLGTFVGQGEPARQKFEELSEWSSNLGQSLEQAVVGFQSLAARGLNPGLDALESYGNTAAAMGKSLQDMIEAVADASTFEFERLKEFGIRASQQTDSVIFRFQGLETEVEKSSEAIQQYLLDIGNTEFDNLLRDRADGLQASLVLLETAWNSLLTTVANIAGFENAADAVTRLAASLSIVKSALVSIKEAWDALPDIATTTFFGLVAEQWENLKEQIELWRQPASAVEGASQGFGRFSTISPRERLNNLGYNAGTVTAPLPSDLGTSENTPDRAFKKTAEAAKEAEEEAAKFINTTVYGNERIIRQQDEIKDGWKQTTDEMRSLSESWVDDVASSFARMVVQGKADWTSLVEHMAIQAGELLLSNAMQTMLGMLGGAGAGGGGFAAILNRPGRAMSRYQHGGRVGKSGVYDVGEAGRERVFLPKGSQVVPSHRMGGNRTVVNVSNYGNNRIQTETETATDGTEIINVLVKEVASDIQNNGIIGQAIDSSRSLSMAAAVR